MAVPSPGYAITVRVDAPASTIVPSVFDPEVATAVAAAVRDAAGAHRPSATDAD